MNDVAKNSKPKNSGFQNTRSYGHDTPSFLHHKSVDPPSGIWNNVDVMAPKKLAEKSGPDIIDFTHADSASWHYGRKKKI